MIFERMQTPRGATWLAFWPFLFPPFCVAISGNLIPVAMAWGAMWFALGRGITWLFGL